MGSTKRRQGRSVSLGLLRNADSHMIGTFTGKKKSDADELPKVRTGWLSVVALSLLRPFRAANNKFQQYRRKV